MSDSVPLDEKPKGNGRLPKTWIVLGLLVVAHAAFGAYFNPSGIGWVDEIRMYLLMGAILSQPVLFAIWASFAHHRFYHRFLWSLLLCILVSFTEDLGCLRLENHRDLGVLMIIDTTFFLMATIILSLFCRLSRWHIKQPDKEDVPSAYQTHQVGIKHLIILTTIIALACGLFRSLHILNPDMGLPPSIAKFIGGTCAFLALLFPVVAMPWITLAYRRNVLSLIIVTIIIGGVLEIATYFLIIAIEPPPPGPYGLIIQLLSIQLGATISAFATTLVIRFCGFKMVRQPKATI